MIEIWGESKSKEEILAEAYASKVESTLISMVKNHYGIELNKVISAFNGGYVSFPEGVLSFQHLDNNIIGLKFPLKIIDNKTNISLSHFKNIYDYLPKVFAIYEFLSPIFDVYYSVTATTKLKLDSFWYKFVIPELSPFNECITFNPADLKIRRIKSNLDLSFRCLLGNEENCYMKFIAATNSVLFGDDKDSYILVDDDIEIVKEKIVLADMISY